MSTDETYIITKWSENTVKVKDSFSVLEEDALVKAEQLPKWLLKAVCFSEDANPRVMVMKSTPTRTPCKQKA